MNNLAASIAIAVCICAVCVQPTFAADPIDPLDVPIFEALFDTTSIDIKLVALPAFVEYLLDFHGVPIEVDWAGLSEVKIDRTTQFTYKSSKEGTRSNCPLYRALWEALGGRDLSFMIVDHKLTITSSKKAKAWQAAFVKRVERTQ